MTPTPENSMTLAEGLAVLAQTCKDLGLAHDVHEDRVYVWTGPGAHRAFDGAPWLTICTFPLRSEVHLGSFEFRIQGNWGSSTFCAAEDLQVLIPRLQTLLPLLKAVDALNSGPKALVVDRVVPSPRPNLWPTSRW